MPSFVLQALKILGPEEILKLTEIGKAQPARLKKVVGIDFDITEKPSKKTKKSEPEGKVIAFPGSRTFRPEPAVEEEKKEVPPETGDQSTILTSEDVLAQWERTKQREETVQKEEALTRYSRSNEMYVVKSVSHEGKKQSRFAATNGVLINKKQA